MANRKSRSSTRSRETGWRLELRHTVNAAAETALRASQGIRRMVLDNGDEIVFRVEMGADGTVSGWVRLVSSRVEKILGYHPEEFIRDRDLWFGLIHPDDVPAMAESTRAIIASGKRVCAHTAYAINRREIITGWKTTSCRNSTGPAS
jgi:PAS domain-containing protein